MKVRKRYLVLAVTVALALLLYRVCHPPARQIVVSDSPDGRLRCIVFEKPPPWPYASPYLYTFTIHKLPAGNTLAGPEGFHDNDSARHGPLRFDWRGNFLFISDTAYSPGPYIFLIAEMTPDEMKWSYPGMINPGKTRYAPPGYDASPEYDPHGRLQTNISTISGTVHGVALPAEVMSYENFPVRWVDEDRLELQVTLPPGEHQPAGQKFLQVEVKDNAVTLLNQ